MNITKTLNGTELTVALEGRLDTVTAPEFERELNKSMEGVKTLTVDLACLEYISSAGLRALLSAHKRMLGKDGMVVKNANEIVREVFEVTGFNDVLTIE